MKENMTLAMEGAGSGVLWGALTFTLLVFTAPFLWLGEAMTDLRWHMGVGLLAVGVPGLVFLTRRRLSMGVILGMALLHMIPGVRVLLPVDHPAWGAGDELAVVEVWWGEEPTGALEDLLATTPADLVVIHGVSVHGRESLSNGLGGFPYEYAWPPVYTDGLAPTGPSLQVFSSYPIADFNAQGFGEGAVLVTGLLETADLDVPLAVVDLPPIGPGDASIARDELLGALDRRYWSERSLVLCNLGSSDSSPSYARLRDATGLADARQGRGRLATSPVVLAGIDLTGAVMPDGPERVPVVTRVRVRA